MKLKTDERIRKAWRKLPRDHEFESFDHFYAVLSELGEVEGEGSKSYYTVKREDEPFGPDNIALVIVRCQEDYDRIKYPAI